MSNVYYHIAGQAADRIVSLSDEIFGMALTLLVLELRLPTMNTVHSNHELESALLRLLPEMLTCLMSFLNLGVFWIAHQKQLDCLDHSDRRLTWIHLGFLFTVAISPFSTKLLADFIDFRVALLIYWCNLLLLGAFLYISWAYSIRVGLLKDDVPARVPVAYCRNVLLAQLFYGIGAALCFINNYWSVGFIISIQIIYAVGLSFSRKALEP